MKLNISWRFNFRWVLTPKKWKAQRPSPTCRMNMQKENCPTCFNENISLSHSQSHVYFKRNNICGQEKCIKHWLFWYHLSTAATLVCMYQCRWTIIPLISIKSCLYAAATFQIIWLLILIWFETFSWYPSRL